MPGQEIPQRIKVVKGEFVPEFPDECEPHTPTPSAYHARFDWMQEMAKTHVQRQCRGCGLWAVWDPGPGAAETVHACPPDGSRVTPCCDRSPFDLPHWRNPDDTHGGDRITEDAAEVTCDGAGA
jgi:hypothetical protein